MLSRINVFSVIAVFFMLASCEKFEGSLPDPVDYGYLSLKLSLNITSEPTNGRTLAVNTDDFRVTIFAADGTEVMVFDPYSSAPAEVQLPTGEYYVEAHSNNLVDAAFENPYYFGRSDNFTIDKEELKSIDIEAELANTKVAINYSANVVNTFHSYTGTVTVASSGASLFYAQGETREGYFLTSPLDIEVNLSYTKLDGTTIDRTFTASIADPQPRTLYNINVDATLEDGKVVFNITVDEGFGTVDIDLGDADGNPNANWTPGDDWVDLRDDEVYSTVQVGDQVWMSENLRFNAQGSRLLFDEPLNEQKYGRLYHWPTLMAGSSSSNSSPSGVQGVCPMGWHVPSDTEWMEIELLFGMPTNELELFNPRGNSQNVGSKLKSDKGEWSSLATNESGFTLLPAGVFGSSYGQEDWGIFLWSSTKSTVEKAYARYVQENFSGVGRYDYRANDIEHAFYCRCVKDPTGSPDSDGDGILDDGEFPGCENDPGC